MPKQRGYIRKPDPEIDTPVAYPSLSAASHELAPQREARAPLDGHSFSQTPVFAP